VIFALRVSDIPNFIIGFVIAACLLGGLIALWKFTGGMPDWILYSFLVGIVIVSFVGAHFLWKVACDTWKKKRVRR
jgi:ABC-type uncharacterized transport system permease subunit